MRLLLLFLVILAAPAYARTPEPGTAVLQQYFPEHNGLVVRKISVSGLKRSREGAVRWLLGAHEGEPFDAQSWQNGIDHLYKTEALYDIRSIFTRAGDGGLEIALFVQDKWTLLPYMDFQGGGGSLSLSAGIFDTNVLGTFTNMYLGGGVLDSEVSYEAGISQKWFLQTTYSLGLDFGRHVVPVSLQNAAGDNQQTFTWARAAQALTVGKQNGEKVYWELKLEAFRDSVKSPTPRLESFLFSGTGQYKISPSMKFWRVSHSDYLEQGHELTIRAHAANPTQATRDYESVEAHWKQVFFLPETKNLAYFLHAGHLVRAPLAYQYRLGGFDSVRGFAMNRIFGLDFARANLELRSTLFTHRIDLFDIGRVVMQGCAFSDAGTMWNSAGLDARTGSLTQTGTRFLYSGGLGVRAIFLHFANAIARLDFARAIVPNEGFNIAFGVGQFF